MAVTVGLHDALERSLEQKLADLYRQTGAHQDGQDGGEITVKHVVCSVHQFALSSKRN